MKKLFLFILMGLVAVACKGNEEPSEKLKKEYIKSITHIEDGDTLITSYEYNQLNQLSKIKVNDITYTNLEYYPSGELAVADTYLIVDSVQNGRTYIVYTYDAASRLKSAKVEYYEGSVLNSVIHLAYVLNNLNQVVGIRSSNADIIPDELITYDDKGNISKIESWGYLHSIETYTYNENKNYLSTTPLKYYVGNNNLFREFMLNVPAGIPIDIYNKNHQITYTDTFNGANEADIKAEYNNAGLPLSASLFKVQFNTTAAKIFNYKVR